MDTSRRISRMVKSNTTISDIQKTTNQLTNRPGYVYKLSILFIYFLFNYYI